LNNLKINKIMKKETLEEAFNKIVDSSDYVLFDYASFEEGDKWQQQNSYSEEEVLEIIALFVNDAPHNTKEWFKQFKKK